MSTSIMIIMIGKQIQDIVEIFKARYTQDDLEIVLDCSSLLFFSLLSLIRF